MSEGTLYNRRMEIREKLAELHAAVLINYQSKSTTLECQGRPLVSTNFAFLHCLMVELCNIELCQNEYT